MLPLKIIESVSIPCYTYLSEENAEPETPEAAILLNQCLPGSIRRGRKQMVLVTGPAWQGKTAFAMELFRQRTGSPDCRGAEISFELPKEVQSGDRCITADGSVCGMDDIYGSDMVIRFHEYVRRFGRQLDEPERLVCRLAEANRDVILVAAEVGCGVVPLDPEERFWRECCGRICTEAAAQAEEVYRVICGIPTRLK